ncbi:MAG: CBS domain-containing protein [Alphaproteobacteria bacterium]|nr:CBS domain-containing protein [Alphaproteobacteria bacterium]
MTRAVLICTPDDTVTQVMKTMTVNRARHLPVVHRDKLVGIVSIGDIVKHRLEKLALEADALRDAYIAMH